MARSRSVARSSTGSIRIVYESVLLRELPETEQALLDAIDTSLALAPALIAVKGAGSVDVEDCYLAAPPARPTRRRVAALRRAVGAVVRELQPRAVRGGA
jgi:hypothetical protein